ncbi:hypothetical protein [Chamaesiphon sp. VAR_48_metabat_135_sub]|uniref:hypothetical protein n=1 Tax=Chamaesiphon sp. VAR_48_metabat_135_sub TaxID=2964699 RepID=UPI00286BE330|nr:hypothetical protein [Chamaesiphon sp. VAR_48_metabat_135_sub]
MVPTDRNTTEETTTEDTATSAKCPECGNEKICRTHRAGKLDRIISLVNIYPYCCRAHTCKARFYRFGRKI